ncbi:MAG: RagB/SusD family nutrient uptake outer membrane protein, partial [Proteiniphilum sp.]
IGYHPVPERDDLGSNSKGEKIDRYGKVTTDARINEIMYNNRDERFYATIVYDSCVWLTDELVTLCVQGNLWSGVRKDKSSSWYTTVSGYYWRKAVANVEPRVYYNNKIDYQFVLIRLGEVYLNMAEAKLLKNDIPGAVAALNETRTKHGGLPPSTASSLDEAWKDYIRERRVDMAYEGDIYWSYLRWGKYGGPANHGEAPGSVIRDLDKPVHKIQIKKDRKEFFIGQITVNNAWNRNFTTKRYLYPIPRSFINGRGAYGIIDTQNPGWE